MSKKDVYLKLTEDEVEDVVCALRSQWANSDNLNITGDENDDLILKINLQKDSICRPYIVTGIHHVQMLNIPMKVIIMAEEPKWAIEYAKEKIEKRNGGKFEAKIEDVHEMNDDDFYVEVI